MTNSDVIDPMIALSGKENAKMKVWGYMKNNMNSWNKFVAKQTIMAKEIGVTRQYIGKALKYLEQNNYIVRNGKEQVNIVFMVNPSYVWTGDKNSLDPAILKYKELITKRT